MLNKGNIIHSFIHLCSKYFLTICTSLDLGICSHITENKKDIVPAFLEFIKKKILGRENWDSQRTTEDPSG